MDNHCQSVPVKFLLVIFIWVQRFTFNYSATCDDNPQVPHAEPNLEGQTPPFPLGTAITFECVSGYVTDLRLLQVTCHEDEDGNATWDQHPLACKPKSCVYPGDVQNARRIGNDFTFSNNVTYVCNEGFKLRGPGTLYCMTSGIWRPALPTCEGSISTPQRTRAGTTPKEVKCSYPAPLENGKFDIEESSEVPHLLRYACNDGTTGIIKCLYNGTWNRRPKCPDATTTTNSPTGEASTTPPQNTDVTTKYVDDQKNATTSSDRHNDVSTTNLEHYSVTTTNLEHHNGTTTNQEHHNGATTNPESKKVTKSEIESTTGTTAHNTSDDITNSTLKEANMTPPQIKDVTTKNLDDQKDAAISSDRPNGVFTTNLEHYSVRTANPEQHNITTINPEHYNVTTTNQESKKVTLNEVESTTGNGSGLTNTSNLLYLSVYWLFYYFAKVLFNSFCYYPLPYSRKSKLQ